MPEFNNKEDAVLDFYLFQLSLAQVWFAAGILIAGSEFLFPTQVSIWSGIAAWLVALLIAIGALDDHSYTWQILWFAIISIALILLWFLVIKKYTKFGSGTVDKDRDTSLTGIKGTITKEITPGKPGKIELYSSYHGIKEWQAESTEIIAVGEEVAVLEADGIKLIVQKEKE